MRRHNKAFTLIEVLVVITIIGLLASIVLITTKGARERAKIAKSLNFAAQVHHSLGAYAVGIWDFDDQVNPTADASGYDNHGTIIGAIFTADTPSGKGYALDFTGNDYVEIASNKSLNPGTDPLTIEVWFKMNAVGALNGSILYNKENLYEASAGGGYFTYAWQPHWAWDGGTSFPVKVGEWYHVVVTYDHVNQYVYKNGQLVYSRPQAGNIGTDTNALRIGARGAPGVASSLFNGLIDDVRIYEEALNSAQIKKLYVEGAREKGLVVKIKN